MDDGRIARQIGVVIRLSGGYAQRGRGHAHKPKGQAAAWRSNWGLDHLNLRAGEDGVDKASEWTPEDIARVKKQPADI